MSEMIQQNKVSPSLEAYIKGVQPKVSQPTNPSGNLLKNDSPDSFSYTGQSRNENYRNTKEGMFLDFFLKTIFFGGAIIFSGKYLNKMTNNFTNLMQKNTGPDTTIKLWENIEEALSIEDMSLPKSLKNLTQEITTNIKNPEEIQQKGGNLFNAILLYGPPGTGKTTYAKALAKDMGVSGFANLDITSLGSKYANQTEKNIQAAVEIICETAKQHPDKKFAVFIDEIDSVIMVDNGSNAKYSNDVLNEFKRCITERLGKQKNIITIGATNIDIETPAGEFGKKSLDSAMLSRLGKKVKVDLPTSEQLYQEISRKYKDASMVCEELKSGEKLKKLCNFMANLKKGDRGVSFRTLQTLFTETASISQKGKPVELNDFIKALEMQKDELLFDDAQLKGLKAALKIE